jgi:two-component system cell cycle sensor histidine kinase/response regulator CckA
MKPKRLKVLYIEDNPDDALVADLKLRDLVDLKICDTRLAYEEALKETWDVVLVDLNLIGFTGSEAITLSKKAHPDTPVIIITGSCNDHAASLACRAGASDYVMKDRLERLPQAIQQAHESQRLKIQRDLELLGDLSAGVAHDTNNLLHVNLAGIELVRRNAGPEDRKILDMMESTCKRGAELLKQMMELARGSKGLVFKTVSLEYLVGEIHSMLRGAFPSNIHLAITTAAGTAHVRCNTGQINQVLLNLCINARDAMPNGGELTISAQNVSLHKETSSGLDGSYVCVTVRDTGSGITEEALPHIFDPFYTTKGKGTGLGLATVKSLIAAHGGGVDVKSGAAGTSFNVYLPVAESAQAKKVEYDGQGKSVLLVDDTDFIRSWLKMTLEEANYRVTDAACGTEAMNLFIKQVDDTDVLVTDLSMPLMTGNQLTRLLRELRSDLPVLYITGFASGGIAQDPEPSGVLHKPFTREAILSELARVLV